MKHLSGILLILPLVMGAMGQERFILALSISRMSPADIQAIHSILHSQGCHWEPPKPYTLPKDLKPHFKTGHCLKEKI